jgi:hypothetical protein
MWWAQQRQREYERKYPVARTIRDEDSDGEDTADFENVVALHATDKALLCRVDGEEVWVPLSQIHGNSEIYEKGHSGKLVVTAWWAKQKGWA